MKKVSKKSMQCGITKSLQQLMKDNAINADAKTDHKFPKVNSTLRKAVWALLDKNPMLTRYELAMETGATADQCRHQKDKWFKKNKLKAVVGGRGGNKEPQKIVTDQDLFGPILKALKQPITISTVAKITGSHSEAQRVMNLMKKKYAIQERGGFFSLTPPTFGKIDLSIYSGGWNRVGLLGDTHLACDEERLDALNAVYDRYAQEGITVVYHAGNIVDGYVHKINGASAKCVTPDDQIQYVIDHYPKREGITTFFITGDDHEGWWCKSGYNFGKHLEMEARSQGRTDLVYIGHVESDIKLKVPNGKFAVMKVMHPGGGSSYARSYTCQKQVESFQGGEKPAILVMGHYHVMGYFQERNTHVVQLPGFQDQTIFARKKRLRMDVGGVIFEWKQNPSDGAVTSTRVEWITFFDRGYYKNFLRSDARALDKGNITFSSK